MKTEHASDQLNQEKMIKLLEEFPIFKAGYRIIKLKGDASYRSYYRLKPLEGDEGSCVLMQWDPALTSKSEEASGDQEIREFPFSNIQSYLHRGGMNVPDILKQSISEGMILLQDIGDTTMEKAIEVSDHEGKRSLYRQAIENLVSMQVLGASKPDPKCLAFGRAFDRKLYMWEFNHFIEYCIEERKGVKLCGDEKKEMEEQFEKISCELDSIPKGFTHRDFQSRNLMLIGGRMFIIDFQDALMGPPQYDLVALLKDSYIHISEKETEYLVEYYLSRRAEAGLPLEKDTFWRGFRLQTVQRKLKDAGRFVFIDRVKKNPSFLPHIPQSLEYVKRYLDSEPDLSTLKKLIARHVPELV